MYTDEIRAIFDSKESYTITKYIHTVNITYLSWSLS